MQLEPADSTAPAEVAAGSSQLFAEARQLVGDRFAEARFDRDRGLRVTVIDLTEHEIEAIDAVAQRLGIGDWVRVERVEPADLAMWERLRHDLLKLQDAAPRRLQSYPTPNPGYRRPPVRIELVADAESIAAELYDTYGNFVALTVGALPYPLGADTAWPHSGRTPRETVSPTELRIELDGPLTLASGEQTRKHLLLTNLSEHPVSVNTNGQLTATIVDDAGVPVGGCPGMQASPLISFSADRAQTVRIPLLVGTASYSPELGYTVPAGRWHLTTPLDLADGRHLKTPALELTITT